jgi:hypothetical protein
MKKSSNYYYNLTLKNQGKKKLIDKIGCRSELVYESLIFISASMKPRNSLNLRF